MARGAEADHRRRPPDPLRDLDHLLAQEARQDRRELFAAVPREDVAVAERRLHRDRRPLEDLVAADVAVRVVHELEAVDVHHQEPHRRAAPFRPRQLQPQHLLELPVVPEPGERIAERGLACDPEDEVVVELRLHGVAEPALDQDIRCLAADAVLGARGDESRYLLVGDRERVGDEEERDAAEALVVLEAVDAVEEARARRVVVVPCEEKRIWSSVGDGVDDRFILRDDDRRELHIADRREDPRPQFFALLRPPM